MRFDEVVLKAYGHFRELTVRFDESAPLHVLWGPNEAGKTTVLSAFRDLLFGIHHQSPYGFRYGNPSIEIRGKVTLSGGDRLAFTRRKATKQPVTGERFTASGVEGLDAAGLERLCAPMTRELFASVFGFTLADLEQGVELLKDASVRELLAGGALGGGGQRVQQCLAALAEDAGVWFEGRRLRTRLREAIDAAESARKDARDLELRGTEIEDLQRRLAEARREAAELDARRRELSRESMRCNLLYHAFELHVQIDDHRKQLESERLATPITDSRRAGQILEDLDSVRSARSAIAILQRQAEEHARSADAKPVEESLLLEEARIESVFERVGNVRSERPKVEQELAALATRRTEVERDFAELMISGTLVAFTRQPAPAAVRERADAVVARAGEIRHEQGQLAKEAAALEEDLVRERERLGELAVAPDEEVGALAAAADRVLRDLAAFETAEEERSELARRLAVGRARLRPALPPDTDEDVVPLPDPDELDAAREKFRGLEDDENRWVMAETEASDRLVRLQAELTALTTSGDVPAPSALGDARDARDAAWTHVRSVLDGETTESPEVIAARFERKTRDADRVADRLREVTDLVAQRVALERDLAAARADVEAARARRAALVDVRAGWTAGWMAIFEPCGVEPGSPERMTAWVRDVTDLAGLAARCERAEERWRHAESQVTTWRERLFRVIGACDDAEAAIGEVRRRHEEGLKASAARAEREGRVAQLARRLEASAARRAELDAEQADLCRQGIEAWPQLGLPPELDLDVAGPRLAKMDDLRTRADDLLSKEGELAMRRRQVAGFDQEVSLLLRDLGRSADGMALTDVVRRLNKDLRENRERDALRRDERHRAEAKRGEAAESLAALDAQEHALALAMEECDADDDVELARFAENAIKRGEVEERLREDELKLDGNLRRYGDKAEALTRLRETHDGDRFLQDHRSFEEQLERTMDRERDVQGELAVLEDKQRQLGTDSAARARGAYAESCAALDEGVDRFLELWLARTVLQRVVDRFVRENQPSILARTSTLISSMTRGRHVKVIQPPGTDVLALVDHHDRERGPEALSTGTHQQLFLALRLAYVLEYAAQHEPLPLVMDDVLVNVDQERQSATLATLAEVGKDLQIIYLTCHEDLVTRLRDTIPTVSVTRLDPDAAAVDRGASAGS